MGFISSITTTKLTEYVPLNNGGAQGLQGATKKASIFSATKTEQTKNQVEKNNSTDAEQVNAKKAEYISKFSNKYNCVKQVSHVENIEKAMRFSRSPELQGVPATLKFLIEDIGKDIDSQIEQFSTSVSECKTKEEVETLAKEFEAKLQQKKHKANVYTQRAQKAQQLDSKLSSIAQDPKKSKLLDKIDMSKIVEKLTGPVEGVEVPESSENSDKTDDKKAEKMKDEAFDKALKDDEISNVIDSLIKYADGGEKDKILDEYLKKDENSNNKDDKHSQFALNPFGTAQTASGFDTNFLLKNKKNSFSSNV